MRILTAGASGQMARSLAERGGGAEGVDLLARGRPDLDIADPASIDAALDAARPDVVVNAAAYTGVDAAEDDEAGAYALNADGAARRAAAAAARGAALLHLSTDYVFDGDAGRPYREDDRTGPRSVYGASKRAGEERVAAAHAGAVIVRTAWVFSPFGGNFVKTMLRLGAGRAAVRVVDDQRGSPTYALHLADAVIAIARRLAADPAAPAGVFHLAGAGEASWADVAEAIFSQSAALGGPTADVVRIPTSDYPTPARRPANSVLDCTKVGAAFAVSMPDWREGVRECVRRVLTA
ncbi:MAG: dTDP-4-dehydrorhamnose reductase [Pseudomonadota bacterium]